MLEQYVARHQERGGTRGVTVGTSHRPRRGLPTTRHDVEFDIDFEAVNPDVDGIIYVGRASSGVRCHQPRNWRGPAVPPARRQSRGRNQERGILVTEGEG